MVRTFYEESMFEVETCQILHREEHLKKALSNESFEGLGDFAEVSVEVWLEEVCGKFLVLFSQDLGDTFESFFVFGSFFLKGLETCLEETNLLKNQD